MPSARWIRAAEAALSSETENLPVHLSPIIYGCSEFVLQPDERAFFKDASPAGFILFKKNCDNPDQVKMLVDELRTCVGWNVPILIDQEGGRVQRLRPPHWHDFPAPRKFGDLFQKDQDNGKDALILAVTALCQEQTALGIDVNCIPCLDVVPFDNNTTAIGDRCFASDGTTVADLGLLVAETALQCGVTPVMKHMAGHGRAVVDSHFALPHVDTKTEILNKTDWYPFRHLTANFSQPYALWGMSAHIIFDDIDPELPGTLSPVVTHDIIRGNFGFKGLLCTDDLFMDALKPYGDVPARVAKALEAGIDLALHCHGTVEEREKALNAAGEMRTDTRDCFEAWHMTRKPAPEAVKPVDRLLSEVAELLG
ncbi:MAG TPA: glycoside hydrolase family 3 N-terminal domain-containing protein [Alphaproteobacteria bacterium]